MDTEELEATKQEIDKLFRKWEHLLENEYVPQPVVSVPEAPKYSASKKKIPIKDYLKRLQKSKAQVPRSETPEKEEKQKKRGGKAVKRRKLVAEAYRRFHLTGNKAEKSKILKEIRIIRETVK